jgi:hypothetical protein
MNELTKSVEQWYRGNRKRIAQHFSKTEFTDETDWDALRGGVHMELEGSTLVATITVWNKGDICAEALKIRGKEIVHVEDRVLNQNEDIAALLDSILERFSQLA